jgi:hypothetical protein
MARACLAVRAEVPAGEAATAPDRIAPLVADFDRVWGDRVTRRRAILDVVQEIGGVQEIGP